jgi:hypothetical protein
VDDHQGVAGTPHLVLDLVARDDLVANHAEPTASPAGIHVPGGQSPEPRGSVAFLKKPADTGTHEIGVRRHDTLALAFDNDGKAGCGLGGMIAPTQGALHFTPVHLSKTCRPAR